MQQLDTKLGIYTLRPLSFHVKSLLARSYFAEIFYSLHICIKTLEMSCLKKIFKIINNVQGFHAECFYS